MSNQLAYMILMTGLGTVGTMFYGSFWSVFVYYHYSVLRPQYQWDWSLPGGIQWSTYVALPAIVCGLAAFGQSFSRAGGWVSIHLCMLLFNFWVVVTYFTAVNKALGYPWLIVVLKIYLMFYMASVLIWKHKQIWWLYLMCAASLGYIAYEGNFDYLVHQFQRLRLRGAAGYDNNGAGLMFAMAVPLCFFAWEALRSRWRWIFAIMIPMLFHAILLTFSRGAMLSLIVATPLMVLRSRTPMRMLTATIVFAIFGLPLFAGKEIQERFVSISKHDADASANSRKSTWTAAYRMACDYPIFGVGIRNANALVGRYGNAHEFQTIHSQYLQLAADYGFVGLGLYLTLLGSTFYSLHQARKAFRLWQTEETKRSISMVNGLECSLLAYCIGAVFLSLETLEVTFLIFLLAAKLKGLSTLPPSDAAELSLSDPNSQTTPSNR